MIISMIILAVMLVFGFIVENYLAGGVIMDNGHFAFFRSWKRTAELNGKHNIVRIILPAVLVAAINFFTVMAPSWVNVIFLIALVFVAIFYLKWSIDEVTVWKEILCFLPLFIIPFIVMMTVAKNVAAGMSSLFLASIIYPFIPWATFAIVALGAFIAFLRKQNFRWAKVASIIIALLLAAALILLAIFGLNWPKKAVDNKDEEPVEKVWYHFFNTDVQYDEDEDNDYNFGPDPTSKDMTAEDYDAEFRARLKKDPALGAASFAWWDANVGGRLLGEFYESCKGDWEKTINKAKVEFMNDENLYKRTLVCFFTELDKADVSIAEGKEIEDQMYMRPYTIDTIPDIVVLKTEHEKGPFLIYSIKIKENTFKVEYRIPCGFQPTNVEEIMHITPQDPPAKKTTPPTTTPPTTNPPEETTTKYNKDPNKSHNSGKNDDPGPGPDTNAGVGATRSTKDQPSNSDHMSSYDEYKEAISELKEANTTTTTAPATTSSSSTTVNVDSNEKEADKPASTCPKEEEVTGVTVSQWSGPSD